MLFDETLLEFFDTDISFKSIKRTTKLNTNIRHQPFNERIRPMSCDQLTLFELGFLQVCVLQNILHLNKFIPKLLDDYRILHFLIEGFICTTVIAYVV